VLIAQLSDPHVRPKDVLYHGVVDSNAGLTDAVEHVRASSTSPDLVLVTGDLVDHGEPAEYDHVREILERLPVPYLVIPGNHDDRENFRSAFADHRYLPRNGPLHYCVDDHPVRVIGLDSTVPGRHHGHVDGAGLDWLATTLAQDTEKPTLIMLHHPPVVSGIPYLDEYRYFEGAELAAVVERAPNVEIVVCGHVHRSMVRRWARTVLISCPSTATEIDLQLGGSAQPSSHGGPRGYLLHLWDERGGMISHVNRVGDFAGPYPFA
jgi:3',5'-cyclic-AMP phosphodiesterase